MINVPYLHFIDVTYGKFLFGKFTGIMMHLALQTCRFNEPAMGNISQTFNVVLKWNPESSDINVTEYTIWRKIKLDSFQEREWQLINIVSTFCYSFSSDEQVHVSGLLWFCWSYASIKIVIVKYWHEVKHDCLKQTRLVKNRHRKSCFGLPVKWTQFNSKLRKQIPV